jgi:hypothetical protein
MPALPEFNVTELRAVRIFDIDAAGRNTTAEELFHGARHRSARFACAHNEDARIPGQIASRPQCLFERRCRIGRYQCGGKNGPGILAKWAFHFQKGSARICSMARSTEVSASMRKSART